MAPATLSAPRRKRIGITLITGFLGSGKSTLIQRLLTEHHGYRLVVVENEFSTTATVEKAIVTTGLPSTDPDASSTAAPSALAEFVELPNGCICCAAQDELADALDRLVARRAADFDHIVVEASGLADPGPVAASLWVDDRDDSDSDDDDGGADTDPRLHLDSVVTVVDAVHFEPLLQRADSSAEAVIAKKQIALADLVLLNKADLVGGPDGAPVARLTRMLRDFGCAAPVLATTRCDVRLSQLLSVRGYDAQSAEAAVRRVPAALRQHSAGAHSSFTRLNIEFAGTVFEPGALNRALGELLWREGTLDETGRATAPAEGMEIWRMKALVVVHDEPNKWIYQSVHTLFDDAVSSLAVKDDAARASSFLFIGQRLNEEDIRSRLSRATVENKANKIT